MVLGNGGDVAKRSAGSFCRGGRAETGDGVVQTGFFLVLVIPGSMLWPLPQRGGTAAILCSIGDGPFCLCDDHITSRNQSRIPR